MSCAVAWAGLWEGAACVVRHLHAFKHNNAHAAATINPTEGNGRKAGAARFEFDPKDWARAGARVLPVRRGRSWWGGGCVGGRVDLEVDEDFARAVGGCFG
jgi:hypothetical protein